MKRIKLKKRRKFDKLNTIIVVIIFLFLSIIIAFIYINSKLSPLLLNFAQLETTNLANLVINRAVAKQLTSDVDINKLFTTVQNSSGEIETIDFNPMVVNKFLNLTTNAVYTSLKAVEEGKLDLVELPDDILVEYDKNKLRKGIIFNIPFGSVTGNAFLSNLGPKIPVKLNLIGSVTSNIDTKIKQYGINNAMIEVYIKIEVVEKINLPFSAKSVKVSSDIPVAMRLIQGKIPSYYSSNGIAQSSPILSLPVK